MTFFGLWGLARHQDMGNDEVVSRWAAALPLRRLAHVLLHIDAVHGLYYLILHGWMIVGTSPATIRLPSMVAMVAAAVLMVILARRLSGSAWVGLFAGLIMAVTPFVSYYAQTARSYALVYACVLGATLALLSALDAEKAAAARTRIARRWALYAAVATVAAYLNEMALLVLAAHAVTVLLARYGRTAVRHWAAASAACVVLAIPVLAFSARQRGAVSGLLAPTLHDVGILYHDYFGATTAAALILVVAALCAVLPPGSWWRSRGGRADGGARADGRAQADGGARPEPAWWSSGGVSIPSVAVPLLLVPAGLLLAESRLALHLYQDRYVMYGEAGVALLAAAGAYRIGQWLAAAARRPELVLVPGLAVCMLAAVLQLGYQHDIRLPESRAYDYGGPAFFVAAHSRPGDGVLFMTSFYRKAELGYPSQFRDTSDFALAVSPSVAKPYQGINKPFTAIRPLMLRHSRIWVLGLRPSGSLAGEFGSESLVLRQHFRRVVMRGYKGIWLSLWIRRQPP